MIAATLLLASLTIPTEPGKHSYDIALETCQDKGGLAQYSDYGDRVEFSCANDINNRIVIVK